MKTFETAFSFNQVSAAAASLMSVPIENVRASLRSSGFLSNIPETMAVMFVDLEGHVTVNYAHELENYASALHAMSKLPQMRLSKHLMAFVNTLERDRPVFVDFRKYLESVRFPIIVVRLIREPGEMFLQFPVLFDQAPSPSAPTTATTLPNATIEASAVQSNSPLQSQDDFYEIVGSDETADKMIQELCDQDKFDTIDDMNEQESKFFDFENYPSSLFIDGYQSE